MWPLCGLFFHFFFNEGGYTSYFDPVIIMYGSFLLFQRLCLIFGACGHYVGCSVFFKYLVERLFEICWPCGLMWTVHFFIFLVGRLF